MNYTYQGGRWQWKMVDDFIFITGLSAPVVSKEFYCLDAFGVLRVRKNYAWDGTTLFPDLVAGFRASAVHDVFCQMTMEKQLPWSYRKHGDDLFLNICLADGMHPVLAAIMYAGVRAWSIWRGVAGQ